MRRELIVLIVAPVLAACLPDITVPDLSGAWDLTPTFAFGGSVSIGDYLPESGEVVVELYAPGDMTNPVLSLPTDWDGTYSQSWWYADPPMDVCDWLARAVLWSGEVGPLVPALADPRWACDRTSHTNRAAALVVAYEPLEEPFVLSGRVLSQDVPAERDVTVQLRSSNAGLPSPVDEDTTTSDADGFYRFETLDPAQRYSWCRSTAAALNGPPGSVPMLALLGQVHDMNACGSGRTFPDFRLGSYKAVTGAVRALDGREYQLLGAGQAAVALLSPADSTQVLDPVETLDDGSFHLWWPADASEAGFPGCDWLLEVELVEDERSVVVPLLADGQATCAPDQVYRSVRVE